MSNGSKSIDVGLIQEKLANNSSILILFGGQISIDVVASSLSLFLTLKSKYREITIASPGQLRAEFSRLIGLDSVSDSINNRDLVILFKEYDFSAIERVSHNDGAENKFELVIQPKAGRKAPKPENVEFSFRGADADLIFLIGLNRLEDLGDIYEENRAIFQKALTVNLGRKQTNTFASIDLLDTAASSVSEIVLNLIDSLGLELSEDIATNLLSGLDFATNRFQNPMITAGAFKTAARLLESGGKRSPARPAQFDNGGFMPFVPPSPFNQPLPETELVPPTVPAGSNMPAKNPPEDWLKPKIFTGTSKV